MAYPASIDAPDISIQGTILLADVMADHALGHRVLGSAVVAIENKLGISSGSAIANQLLVGVGVGSSSWGTIWNGGNIGSATIGTPQINHGTANNMVMGSPAMTGGTANNMVLGTPTIGTITIPGTVNALSFSAAIAPGVGTITDTVGTMIVNAQQGNVFYSVQGTTAGNRTIGTPLNPTAYQQITFAFKASGSSNGTLVWSTPFRISRDVGTPAIGTGTSWNYYNWRYNAIDSKYDFMGQSLDII